MKTENKEVVEKTREEVIDELIEDEVEHFLGNEDYLSITLMNGYKGYKDYTNEELIEEWENNIGKDEIELKIIG
jgi:hypothetical protein